MRASLLFLPPYKRLTASAQNNPTKLLANGGYIRKLEAGLYAYLPLGMLVLQNIIDLIKRELKNLGGQEVLIPMLNPLEVWEATGRDKIKADELLTITDTRGKSLVVAPTHEEAMIDLIKNIIHATWQLPAFFYQVQAKGRDLGDDKLGILKAREYIMNDGYSIHRSFSELNNFIPRVHHAYERVLSACTLKPLIAEGASFNLGGERSYDFLFLNKSGDYQVVICDKCGYVCDQEVAVGLSKITYSKPLKLEKIKRDTLEDLPSLAKTMGIPNSRITVVRIFSLAQGYVMLIHRADHLLSQEKTARILGEALIQELSSKEIEELGLVPHFCSPLGLKNLKVPLKVVADNLVAETPNLIVGANDSGTYWINANFGRDFEASVVGDICRVDDRNRCYHCGGSLQVRPAFKLASLVRINNQYTKRLGMKLSGTTSEEVYPFIGSYSLSLERLISSVAMSYQDKRGLRWPLQIAPYKAVLHIVGKASRLYRLAEEIHEELGEYVLWDDRPLRFMQKCRDADRMGIPIRVIISAATLRDRSVTLLSRTGILHQRVSLEEVKKTLLEYWRQERQNAGLIKSK